MERRNPTLNDRLPHGTIVRHVHRGARFDIVGPVVLALIAMVALLAFTFVRDAGATGHDTTTTGGGEPVLTQAVINSDGAWVVGIFPAGSGRWLLETYNPTDYNAQTLTASVLVDATLTEQTVDELLPVYDPGCAQLDIRREGSDESIGGDLHQESCVVTPATTTTTTVAPPAPPVRSGGSEQAGETATTDRVVVSSGPEETTPTPSPLVPAPLAPAPLPAEITRSLAYTGPAQTGVLVGTAALLIVGGFTLVRLTQLKRRHQP